jgi:hypothetical protein
MDAIDPLVGILATLKHVSINSLRVLRSAILEKQRLFLLMEILAYASGHTVAALAVPQVEADSNNHTSSVKSNSGNYIVEYRTDPSPIPINEMFELRVNVRERLKRAPAKYVTLDVDAGMSVHNHGMNTKPVVERMPNGIFRVHGLLFHMVGTWEMTFTVKRGILSDRAETVVEVQ